MRKGPELKAWLNFAVIFVGLWIVAVAAIAFDMTHMPEGFDEFPDQALGMGPPSIFLTVFLLLPLTVSFFVSACGRFLFLSVTNRLRGRKVGRASELG